MMTTALEATDKDFERMMQMLTNFFCDTDSRCCGVTETTEMSTGNSANKLWRRRDVIKLLGATAIAGPVILRGTTAKAASSKVIKMAMSVRKPERSPLLRKVIHLSSTRSELRWRKELLTAGQATKSKSSARTANRIPTELPKSLLT